MSRGARVHLFVLIDAFGWRFIEGKEFLSDLLTFRKPLRTVLGYSSGAIPTILTGLPPAQNGHWNLLYYDPKSSPFRWLRYFQFLPDRVLNHRVTRKLLKETGRHLLGMGPLFECCVSPRLLPWFNWAEKRNVYARGGIPGVYSIFDHLEENSVPYCVYSYHRWTDKEILQQARRDLQSSKARFFFLYLSEMDVFLHNHCEDGEQVEQRLGWYAAGLRGLFELAQRLDPEVCLTVLSDHGMTPVQQSYDLVKDVESLGFNMPRDFLAVYDSTMARFWFFREHARQQFPEYLKTLPCGRILSDEELCQLGVYFPDFRYGEIIFLLHPGWLMSHSDFNGRGWTPHGMHGYHPDDPYSDAVFLSNKPSPVVLHSIADVYNCMREAARG